MPPKNRFLSLISWATLTPLPTVPARPGVWLFTPWDPVWESPKDRILRLSQSPHRVGEESGDLPPPPSLSLPPTPTRYTWERQTEPEMGTHC